VHRIIQEILIDNEWRDRDFARFKIFSDETDEALWNRMCVPMIYAHWEGFVVNALKTLLTYLNRLNLAPNNIKTHLIVVCLADSYKRLSGKQSFEQRIDFTTKFQSRLTQNVKFQKNINTKSNLKSSVLEEICNMYGFNFEKFKKVTNEIDRLVSVRNSIAHGENSIIPSDENIKNYIETVRTAMDLFLEEIDIFIENENYLLSTES
jgi:hypothetical protein